MTLALGQWSLTATTNGFAVPDGAPEGWFGGEINAWGREIMSVIRTWYDDPEWLTITEDLAVRGAKTVVKLTTSSFQIQNCDATDYFTAGRRVRLRTGVSSVEGHIVSSSFGGTHTDVVLSSPIVPASIDADGADVYFAKSLDPSAFVGQPNVGDVKMTAALQATLAASNSWLECNGQEIAVADYPDLADALGSPLGTQEGHYDLHPTLGKPTIGYVRVPDLAGRVPVGFWDDLTHPDGADPDAEYDYTNGATTDIARAKAFLGAKNHEITEAEMPAHDHDFVSDGAHVHPVDMDNGSGGVVTQARAGIGSPSDPGVTTFVQSAGAHDHSFASKGDATNNKLDLRQASIVMGFVIYTGVA